VARVLGDVGETILLRLQQKNILGSQLTGTFYFQLHPQTHSILRYGQRVRHFALRVPQISSRVMVRHNTFLFLNF
jgi:hypothetical protein